MTNFFINFLIISKISILLFNSSFAQESDCGCSEKINRQPQQVKIEQIKSKKDDIPQQKFNENSFPENNDLKKDELYDEMVYIEAGEFVVGSDKPVIMADGEGPERMVVLDGFWIDVHEVSNAQFEKFVRETGYVTEAEKYGNSFVLEPFVSEAIKSTIKQAAAQAPWWLSVNNSDWRQPTGPDSDINLLSDYPVVHVSWTDATTFCSHYHKKLPSEAEWEVACRAGKVDRLYPWGNKEQPNNEHRMNIWQGTFPNLNTLQDGYASYAPVWSYKEQNTHKLKNMVGNVWEWVGDWWSVRDQHTSPHNPKGPSKGTKKVKKGGSFACHKSYCYRYRCGARHSNTPDSSAYNLGFRCASDGGGDSGGGGGHVDGGGGGSRDGGGGSDDGGRSGGGDDGDGVGGRSGGGDGGGENGEKDNDGDKGGDKINGDDNDEENNLKGRNDEKGGNGEGKQEL